MSLRDILIRRIAAQGPMTLADYMAECLLHPQFGYYATRDPFGRAGDFTTAPEISQMFGEMIGLFLGQVWTDQGGPDPFILAEPGPGRGTLMADILRTIRAVPGMRAAARVHLAEASPTLRAVQAKTLSACDPPVGPVWHGSTDDIPEGPLFLVANEFFDALPIRQFVRRGSGWAETQIGLTGDALGFGLGPPAPLALLADRLADTGEGGVVEICPSLPAVAAGIARRIGRHGGVALAIDYGGWRSRGDTFQALRGHAVTDPLAEPGNADLTAHVDFEALARSFAGSRTAVTAMTAQGVFLERLGITERAQALAARMSGDALRSHAAAHRRLTHPSEMGNLFRVIACMPRGAPLPPGLDTA